MSHRKTTKGARAYLLDRLDRHEAFVTEYGTPQRMTVSPDVFAKMMDLVENPPEPTDALRRLMRPAPDVYEQMIARCNEEIAQAVLGSTLTTDRQMAGDAS